MVCKICGRKTTWDESFGPAEYLVCPVCFNQIRIKYKISSIQALKIIFNKAANK